jgi:3-oxoacyl-[acyl-carrier-protein] synthase II
VKHRVVVTGFGVASPIGNTADEVVESLRSGQSGVEMIPEWDRYRGMFTRLGAPVKRLPLEYPRKSVRTMGRVSLLALHATDQALAVADLAREELSSDRVGVAYGSTHGSSSTMERALGRVFGTEPTFEGMASSSYPAFMSHTTAANLAIYYGIRGRVFTTCSACTSGSQGIGYAYEAIRDGTMDVMVAGGAEELHAIHAGIFDVMYATSTHFNDRPDASPRPYDSRRDGLVVGEGAGTLLLEPLEQARTATGSTSRRPPWRAWPPPWTWPCGTPASTRVTSTT